MKPKPANNETSNFHRIWFYLLVISCLSTPSALSAQCIGGQVFANSGSEMTSLCLDDAINVGLNVYSNSSASTAYAYVVTDINNQILSYSDQRNLKFENLIEGVYYVYGFSYQGDILARIGDYVYSTKFAADCWQISYNRIEVKLATPNSSEIRTPDFKTEKNICLNAGEPDFVGFQNISTKNTPYVFLITDVNGTILEVNFKTFADFSNSPVGECKIYGLGYTGQLLAQYGMNINETLSTGCYQLSDNAIDVNRARVKGGQIYTQDAQSFYTFTTDDAQSNILSFTNTGGVEAEYAYVLTDASNNILTRLESSSIDMEGYSAGTYRIWGFSYSGDILLDDGQSIFSGPFSSGCFQRSFNAITVTTEHDGIVLPPCVVASTTISALSETTICQNGPLQTISTDAEMSQGLETTLLIVDQANTIVSIAQISELHISLLQPGAYSIFQVVYDNIDGLLEGSSLNNLSGCYALSNSIPLNILSANDAECTTEEECILIASTLSVDRDTVCIEDSEMRTISFEVDNIGLEAEGILITDEAGVILELSADRIFEINTAGSRTFYHINYVDTVLIFGGESIDDLVGCYAISNPITVVGQEDCFVEPCAVVSAVISTASATSLCTLDSSDDEVEMESDGGSGVESLFLVTEAGSTIISSSSVDNLLIFDIDMPGDFEVYQLDYAEPFSLADDLDDLEGCFALSNALLISNSEDNCIIEPDPCLNNGGEIVYNGPAGICGDDGQNDVLDIDVVQSGGSNRVFLLVNENDIIVNIAPAIVILNNPFPEGSYKVYALSYDDFPTGLMSNSNINDLEDLCLSNSIDFVVSNDFCLGAGVRGGQVSDEFGQDEIRLCTNVVGEVFTIDLANSGSTAFDYQYVETDENNIITNIINGNTVMYNADPTERMNNRIWGVSYTGLFTAFVGEDITSVQLSDETFNVSDNFIVVEIAVVIGEDPEIVGSEAPYAEVPTGQEIILDLAPNMSAFLDYETAYILFDIDGVTILDILYPDEDFNIVLPSLEATPLTGELLALTTIGYTGEILLEVGGQANAAFLPNATDVTTGCFDVANVNISIRVFDDGGGVDMPLGENLNNSIGEDVSLRPNPVKEILEVTFPKSFIEQKTVLNIYSIAGDLILSKDFVKAPTIELIDVSGFSNGMYTLQVYTNFSARTVQFLKI